MQQSGSVGRPLSSPPRRQRPEVEEEGGRDGEPAQEGHRRRGLEGRAVVLGAPVEVVSDEDGDARRRAGGGECEDRRDLQRRGAAASVWSESKKS